MNELRNRKQEARMQSLQLDQHLLELDRLKASEESQARLEKRKMEELEGKNNLLLQEFRDKQSFIEKQREQREFNELQKRNFLKEVQKEANYKNVNAFLPLLAKFAIVLEKRGREPVFALPGAQAALL